MRHAVNPSKRDYGGLLYGWQDTAVQYTIANWVWWCSVIAVLCLLAALGYIWWYTELWEVRQECFVRAAAVLIGQRNTAYQSARFAINKHNALVERYDRLFVKVNEAERSQQVAEQIENGRQSAQPLFPADPVTRRQPLSLTHRLSRRKTARRGENQSLKSTAPIMSGWRTTCGASTHSRPNSGISAPQYSS